MASRDQELVDLSHPAQMSGDINGVQPTKHQNCANNTNSMFTLKIDLVSHPVQDRGIWVNTNI